MTDKLDSTEFRDGVQWGIQMWGELCSSQGTCEGCPVGAAKGELTCQEFAAKFPGMFGRVLEEAKDGHPRTYYNEFCARFHNNSLPLELVARALCRKAIFEGSLECEVTDDVDACMECWCKPCITDVETPEAGAQREEFDLDSIDF